MNSVVSHLKELDRKKNCIYVIWGSAPIIVFYSQEIFNLSESAQDKSSGSKLEKKIF